MTRMTSTWKTVSVMRTSKKLFCLAVDT
jgi:hypothetical protein